MKIIEIYERLKKKYGPQGWWPISNIGYHPNDYSYPRKKSQIFEICLGCYLTQNTSWSNAQKAIDNLNKINSLTFEKIKKLSDGKFKEMIKPARYYNQKFKYLREFFAFYENKLKENNIPTREELLNLLGVGEETADSILLYAYKQPEFIVDTYTRRILIKKNLIDWKTSYQEIKDLIQKEFQDEYEKEELVNNYQEFHALLVEHAKHFYIKKPFGTGDEVL